MIEDCEQKRNAIIEALSYDDGRRFEALCDRIAINQGDILCESDQELEAVYFPVSGVISLAMAIDNQPPLELGMIGRDGMLGATLSLGILTSPMRAVVQLAGTALVMATSQFQEELRTNSSLLKSVHYYQLRLMMQTEHTAVCLNVHQIESRLARWLLMIRDLDLTDTLHLTHKQLARALGVRRSGITHAVGSLHQQGLICHSRGRIRILDHVGLESAACDCYTALINRYRTVSEIS